MRENNYRQQHQEITALLEKNQLLDAIDRLIRLATATSLWQIQTDMESLRHEYALMLDYLNRGIVDTEQDRLYSLFWKRTTEANEKAFHSLLTKENTFFLHLQQNKDTQASIALFNQISASAPFQKEDYNTYREILQDAETDVSNKVTIVAALSLSLLLFFDEYKIKLLLDNAENTSWKVRARCIVGIVLTFIIHDKTLRFYPQLLAQQALLADAAEYADAIRQIQFLLFLTKKTKETSQKVETEILSGIMNAVKKPLDIDELKKRFSQNDIQDFNPAWNFVEENEELQNYMKQFMEMQEKGVDTFYGNFQKTATRFPYFSIAANWFIPYGKDLPIVREKKQIAGMLDMMFHERNLCNTDKLTTFLAFSGMETNGLSGISQQLKDLFEQNQEIQQEMMMSEEEEHNNEPDRAFQEEIRNYIHDLYRFFTLFYKKDEWINPFQQNLRLTTYDAFKDILQDQDIILSFAHYAFAEKDWTGTLYYFNLLNNTTLRQNHLEQIGYCHLQLKQYRLAAESFESARLHEEATGWCLRQLVRSYININEFNKATAVLEELELTFYGEENLGLDIALSYMKMSEFNKAIRVLNNINSTVESDKVIRAQAWCLLQIEQPDEAAELYAQLIEKDTATSEDFMNAGHVALVSKDLQTALRYYRTSILKQNRGRAHTDFFDNDEELLKRYGISTNQLQLLRDAVNIEINYNSKTQ